MKRESFILGLDLGVGSVGWSCMILDTENEPKRILDLGSRIFAQENGSMEDRRNARGLRRVLRRRKARVKQTKALFSKYDYLDQNVVNAFFDVAFAKYDDPYQLKVKGLSEKLKMEELFICLVHYSKNRGYKSNRKNREEGKNSRAATEEQKLLFSIQHTQHALTEKNITISMYLESDPQFKNKKRNTDGELKIGITRSMIVDEATLLLEKQLECGLICEEFKDDYLRILTKQLSFSSGPEIGPYHDPIIKMIGTCIFDGEDRAPNTSASYELFNLVQKLQSISYSEHLTGEVKNLTTPQIKALIDEATVGGRRINYGSVQRVIGHPVVFRNLTLTRQDYFEIAELRERKPNLSLEDAKNVQKLSREIYELRNTNDLTKNLKKLGFDSTNILVLDSIANLLSRYKSDDEIISEIERDNVLVKESEGLKKAIIQLDENKFKTFGKLSFNVIRKILPLMVNDNLNYSEAMKVCGFKHPNTKKAETEYEKLPPIKEMFDKLDKNITNRCVIATLNETRKIVNAIINTYGKPYAIHIVIARELTKNDRERADLIEKQLSNQVNITTRKMELLKKYPHIFSSIDRINRNDLIKYQLFIEQKGICPYTLAKTSDKQQARIQENNLFTDDYEIDYIMPYSMSFNDTLDNKALVFKEMISNKRERLPYQAFGEATGYAKFETWVELTITSQKKQEAYLAKAFTDEMKDDFVVREINYDARYATKTIVEILRYSFPSIKVKSFTGQITNKLKGVWGLKNLTHSYLNTSFVFHNEKIEGLDEKYLELSNLLELDEDESRSRRRTLKKEIMKIEYEQNKSNRSNHLHHALDATIIACATDTLRRRVGIHESYLKQKTSKKIVFRSMVYDETTNSAREETFERFSIDYDQLFDLTRNIDPKHFPTPYMSFRHEVILRVYERNQEQLFKSLIGLSNYDQEFAKKCKPILISHQCTKKTHGRLHRATIMGVAPNPENKKEIVLTNRININSPSFDAKKLEKLYDKETTQKTVYITLNTWIDGFKNGQEAYNAKKYPRNNNGNEIKKVKLNYGAPKEEILIRSKEKQYVEKEEVIQIHIFTKEGSDRLFFVGMDRYRVLNLNKDINITIWWGRVKNYKTIKYKDLSNEGLVPYVKLYKDQVILLELFSGGKGLCKVGGYSSGMLEIKSLLGDGSDLVESTLQLSPKERYQISISQIKSIEIVHVNILGKKSDL